MVVSTSNYVADASLFFFHEDNNEDYDKQERDKNIKFEAKIASIKKNLFHRLMVDFVDKLELSDQKYQTNVTVRDENHNVEF